MSRTFWATTAVVAVGAFLLGGTNADASVKIAWAAKNPTLEVNALGAAEISWTTPVGRQASRQGAPHGRAPLRGGRKGVTSLHAAELSACRSGRWSGRPRTGRSGRCNSGAASGVIRSSFASRAGAARRPASRFEPSAASGEASESQVRRASMGGRSTATTTRRPESRSTSTGGTCTSTRFRYGGWKRMMGILTHRYDGTYSLWIRRYWRGKRYRATISGPNWGWTIAPDARASTNSAL